MTRQRGAALLAVTIMLTIMATLAFTMNRQAGMATQSVETQYDQALARYLAEAGLNLARWSNQNQGCKAKSAVPITGMLAGMGSFSAVVTKAASKNIDVVSTGITSANTTAVLSRVGVPVHQLQNAPESKTLGGTIADTYLNTPFPPGVVNNGSKTLYLVQGQSQALLQFPLTDIPADSLVSGATLTMVQNGVSAVQRPVSVHRVTAQWDAPAATWTAARAGTAWASPGGDYAATPVAQTSVGSATSYAWDITTLVDGWINGNLPNYGLLLRMVSAQQSANFYSFESGGALKPVISVTFYKPC